MPNPRWPFLYDPQDEMVTLKRIIAGDSFILLVTHDAEGGYQFLDGEVCDEEDAAVVSLKEMLDRDPTLAEIACLPPGFYAARAAPEEPWRVWAREDSDEGADQGPDGGDA